MTERDQAESPNYKFKFETLVEHCKRQDQVIADLRYDQNVRSLYDDGAVWFWCGDGTDNLETLACPVVIAAGDLRALIAAGSSPADQQKVSEADFHKRIRGFLTKRQQGYVMQAFRELVPYYDPRQPSEKHQ